MRPSRSPSMMRVERIFSIVQSERSSFTTSVAYGPTIGKNIALAYLPQAYAREGRKLMIEYFGEAYPVEVAAVGYKPLYDPENLKPRS